MNTRISCLILLAIFFMCNNVAANQQPPPSLFVEGYTNDLSYAPGEEVAFHLSTTAAKVSITIKRLGASDVTVWEKPDVPGSSHPIPDQASSHGCNWPEAFRLKIPANWQSGYYQATLEVSDHGGKFVHRGKRTARSSLFFVVRSANPGKDTKILLQLSTNTYNAYTNWGGHSLYSYHARDGVQGNRVSF